MSDITFPASGATTVRRVSADLYRAVWRWHFFAGLFVLPFLVTLSVTGALYLFRDELDAIIHADLKRVEIRSDAAMARPSAIVAAALDAYPGTAVKFTDPATPDASAEVTVRTEAGDRLAVHVDPQDARVLGAMADRGTVMWTIRSLHSLKYFGPVARGIIEIAAGWTILMVATGIYLWWPRGRKGGVVSLRGTPKRRTFWRDTHAVVGLFAGGFIAFLAITGLPWSNVWGSTVNQWANGSNFGYPSGVRVDVPMSDRKLAEMGQANWSLEQARLPVSQNGGAADVQPVGLDRVVATLDGLGLHRGYAVSLPNDPAGVYTGSVYPDDLARQRVVHLDQYSGLPLIDMGYADYGPLGRWLEFGINVHMGQEFGLANQLLMLAVCLAGIVLSVSAAIMWWKRRPAGTMGVPPLPQDRRVFAGLLAILAIGGVLFPLVGLSLIVMLALDLALSRFWRRGRA